MASCPWGTKGEEAARTSELRITFTVRKMFRVSLGDSEGLVILN